jgi:HEAT repeat protein
MLLAAYTGHWGAKRGRISSWERASREAIAHQKEEPVEHSQKGGQPQTLAQPRVSPQEAYARVEAMRLAAIAWKEAALREDPSLYDNLRGGHPGPPMELMESVLQAGPDTIEALLALLTGAGDEVAYLSVCAVAHFGAEAVSPLLNLLLHKPQARMWAGFALGLIRAPAVVPLLRALEVAHAQGDTLLRYWLLYALLKTHDPRIVAPLVRLLPQLEENERRDVVESLQAIRDPDVLPTLRVRLGHETSPKVRTAIVRALGRIDGVGSLDLLLGALKDRSQCVRCEALQQLGQLKEARAIPALLRLLRGQRDWEAASGALALMGVRALPQLAEALSWPEPRERQHAARALTSLYLPPEVAGELVGDTRSQVIQALWAAREEPDAYVADAVKKVLEALQEAAQPN